MNDASDRNLLIGVLAFNNGFVDQPQLVEAMRDWMENKSRSLAVVLRERQVISTAEQELLLALVERHLQRFDGDSQAGYEHLSGLSGIGIHLDTLGEPGQEGSIDTVLQTRRDEGAEKRPVESTDNAATRYLINDVCVILGLPLVSGSALQWEGQITVLNYKGGPCYRCLYP